MGETEHFSLQQKATDNEGRMKVWKSHGNNYTNNSGKTQKYQQLLQLVSKTEMKKVILCSLRMSPC